MYLVSTCLKRKKTCKFALSRCYISLVFSACSSSLLLPLLLFGLVACTFVLFSNNHSRHSCILNNVSFMCRYYNWQIAAPMLMSHVVFQRPLIQVRISCSSFLSNIYNFMIEATLSCTVMYLNLGMSTAKIFSLGCDNGFLVGF